MANKVEATALEGVELHLKVGRKVARIDVLNRGGARLLVWVSVAVLQKPPPRPTSHPDFVVIGSGVRSQPSLRHYRPAPEPRTSMRSDCAPWRTLRVRMSSL